MTFKSTLGHGGRTAGTLLYDLRRAGSFPVGGEFFVCPPYWGAPPPPPPESVGGGLLPLVSEQWISVEVLYYYRIGQCNGWRS